MATRAARRGPRPQPPTSPRASRARDGGSDRRGV